MIIMAQITLHKSKINKSIPKDEANKIYNSPVWKRLRAIKMTNNPLCEDCLESNIIIPALEIHHIIPFMSGITHSARLKLAYDYNNLKSLCAGCHDKKHYKINN